ncbi:MAG: DUF1287 domain-containing protein [Clostridia bacterium]|nr:DUF1287 domain-containing protein [Clostridia bacterium]
MKRTALHIAIIFMILLVAAFFTLRALSDLGYLPGRVYSAEDFGIETLQSPRDADGDGLDDYTDMLLAARARIESAPQYVSAYYAGGYPPEGEGVCTDVIWIAFRAAGYDFKALVDADIAARPEAYTAITTPDPNIDFRRVRNLRVFLAAHARSLTCDVEEIDQWQPGDIVVYAGHIGIVSDKRNRRGIPYIIHHGSGTGAEENAITHDEIVGHYRWEG